MADETRAIFLRPDRIAMAISPRNRIAIRLDAPREETGLAPGVFLALELTATEALALADQLRNMTRLLRDRGLDS